MGAQTWICIKACTSVQLHFVTVGEIKGIALIPKNCTFPLFTSRRYFCSSAAEREQAGITPVLYLWLKGKNNQLLSIKTERYHFYTKRNIFRPNANFTDHGMLQAKHIVFFHPFSEVNTKQKDNEIFPPLPLPIHFDFRWVHGKPRSLRWEETDSIGPR